jgi:ribosomal protein S18 acetylase RimI-like enzyme
LIRVAAVPAELTRPLRKAVLRPHESLEELASHEQPGAHAVGAFEGERLIAVGFVGADGEPDEWRVRGMATEPDARGRGAGSAVLDALIEHAADQGATRIWCNARIPAVSLYARAGFEVESEEFEIPGIGPHVVMARRV